jgi:multidrug efflux pump subunit AcrB
LVTVQLPNSSSLERTQKVTADLSKRLDKYPEIDTYLVINGFSVVKGGNISNEASVFVMLKDWDERKDKNESAAAVIERINAESSEIQEANIFAVNPPSIPGLGASGGLAFVLEDRNNLGTTELANAVNIIIIHHLHHHFVNILSCFRITRVDDLSFERTIIIFDNPLSCILPHKIGSVQHARGSYAKRVYPYV